MAIMPPLNNSSSSNQTKNIDSSEGSMMMTSISAPSIQHHQAPTLGTNVNPNIINSRKTVTSYSNYQQQQSQQIGEGNIYYSTKNGGGGPQQGQRGTITQSSIIRQQRSSVAGGTTLRRSSPSSNIAMVQPQLHVFFLNCYKKIFKVISISSTIYK
jgi:hypothetical protein